MNIQQDVLRLYKDYQSSPPSVRKLFGRSLWRYLLLIFVFVLGIALAVIFGLANHAFLMLGLLVGALLRDLASFIRFVRTWPVTESVLDWDRIDTLLEADA